MSGAIVDGLHAVGARQLAVSTAYTCEVNELLTIFLRQKGFEVRSLQSLGAAKAGRRRGTHRGAVYM